MAAETADRTRSRRRERSSERRSRRDRSKSASRERRSSRRSSRSHTSRRSASRSRSRSRERSGRSHRRHHRSSRRGRSPSRSRSRSRSKSRERHKRRRRNSREDTRSRRQLSADESKDRKVVPEAVDSEKEETLAVSARTEVVVGAKLQVIEEENANEASGLEEEPQKQQSAGEQGDVVMADSENAAKQALQPVTSPAAVATVASKDQTHEPLKGKKQETFLGQEESAKKSVSESTTEAAAPREKSAVKPGKQSPPASAVDVSSIKMDILKALAEARSTIAGIKQNGSGASVPKPTESVQGAETAKQSEEESDMKMNKPKSPVKTEMVSSPQKTETTAMTVTATAPTTASSSTDDFDMFSMAALDANDMAGGPSSAAVTVNEASLQSNCDDPEGYYSTTVGEVLNGKYRVLGAVGKGVFSTVLRCQCLEPLRTGSGASVETVAVKLIRNNDVMRDAAQTEMKLLKELSARDPRDKKHCIRLLDSFAHRNHVAMVFEPMQMNLREAMKKFGGKSGISIQAVRVFSKHLLIALNHLEACGVIHADIKPDNILLDEKQTTIKLCDFGSAFKVENGKQDPTPYLVSRFYRAPEIVLGLAYDKAVDMWSVGCCLYEMFTGKVLFPGSTNNEMLKLFMELKGKIPNKLIKRHRQAYIDQFEMEPHFTEDLKFCSRESDRVTGKPILRLMEIIKAKNDLASSLLAAKTATDERKQVLELRSLLDRMFTLDPSKRISVREALAHPFVKG